MGISLSQAIFGGLAVAGSAALIAATAGAATPAVAEGDAALAGADTVATAGTAATATTDTALAANTTGTIGAGLADSTATTAAETGAQGTVDLGTATEAPILSQTGPSAAPITSDISATTGPTVSTPNPLLSNPAVAPNSLGGNILSGVKGIAESGGASGVENAETPEEMTTAQKIAVGTNTMNAVGQAYNATKGSPQQPSEQYPSAPMAALPQQAHHMDNVVPQESNTYQAIFGSSVFGPLHFQSQQVPTVPAPPQPQPIMSDRTNKTSIRKADRSVKDFLNQVRRIN